MDAPVFYLFSRIVKSFFLTCMCDPLMTKLEGSRFGIGNDLSDASSVYIYHLQSCLLSASHTVEHDPRIHYCSLVYVPCCEASFRFDLCII